MRGVGGKSGESKDYAISLERGFLPLVRGVMCAEVYDEMR